MKKITSFAELEFDSVEPQLLGNCVFFTRKAYIEYIRHMVENAALDDFQSYMNGDSDVFSLQCWGNWTDRGLKYLLRLWNIVEESFYKQYKKSKIEHAYYISYDAESRETFTIELVPSED